MQISCFSPLQLIFACATTMKFLLLLWALFVFIVRSCQDKTECLVYTTLSEADRRLSFSRYVVKCDFIINKKWYRFTGAAGSEMAKTCVPIRRCGTHAPGWLNGKHPTVAERIVTRQVCYHWSGECCKWSNTIRVRNCGEYYVYELLPPPTCSLRYCGAPGISKPAVRPNLECQSYVKLREANRRMSFRKNVNIKCDRRIRKKWYRFSGGAGSKMANRCVQIRRCGSHAPGWLKGKHPTVGEGIVTRKVCYHWRGECCHWKNRIRIRNCGNFFVYELVPTPACHLRYCGAPGKPHVPTVQPNSECQSYTKLYEADRRVSFSENVVKCDRTIRHKWYRFAGTAGREMAGFCVPIRRCGTHAPGWLNGKHPTVAEGIVTRQVCYHWSGKCCRWSNNIRVRNCGKFYVYELVRSPACKLRYCAADHGSECIVYTKLNQSDRAVSKAKKLYRCDRNMKKRWYRFVGGAGNRMPQSCPEPRRCGALAPGWLHGKHPLPEEGVVDREVCFHWNSDCCRWTKEIRVRNCGEFYVYELDKTPACNLRYCGNNGED